MFKLIRYQFKDCKQDTILIDSLSDKAFCAGGDIKIFYKSRYSINKHDLFREEYQMDYEVSQSKKNTISIINGIVMGGGVGLYVNTDIRIVTEKTVWAMPEAAIGLYTDVGLGFHFSKLGSLGVYLALTGKRLFREQVVQAGFADFFVKSENLQKVYDQIFQIQKEKHSLADLKAIISQYSEKVDEANLFGLQDGKENYFSGQTWDEFRKNNIKHFNQQFFNDMQNQCPFSQRIIFQYIKQCQNLDLKDVLKLYFRLTCRFQDGDDLYQGIKATLFDKNHKPKWTHKHLDDVQQYEIDLYFKPLDNELSL